MPDTSLADALAEGGHRLTPQRRAVLEALGAERDHPTAYELHRRVRRRHPRVSLATVYNTLEILEAVGLVQELPGETGARYDIDTRPHVHVLCADCGRIADLDADRVPLAAIDRAVARASGFAIDGPRLVVYRGRCPSCRGAS